MTPWQYLYSREEQLLALRVGAQVLRERWPEVKVRCTIDLGLNRVQAFAVLSWPGVTRVTQEHDGRLIAKSKPGLPFDLDERDES